MSANSMPTCKNPARAEAKRLASRIERKARKSAKRRASYGAK